jgi:hypothetical protein
MSPLLHTKINEKNTRRQAALKKSRGSPGSFVAISVSSAIAGGGRVQVIAIPIYEEL